MELYDFFNGKEIYFSNQIGADVQVSDPVKFVLTREVEHDEWVLHILEGDVIVNYFVPEQKTIKLVSG